MKKELGLNCKSDLAGPGSYFYFTYLNSFGGAHTGQIGLSPLQLLHYKRNDLCQVGQVRREHTGKY